jgi:two-component system, NtrC family, sensor kinase
MMAAKSVGATLRPPVHWEDPYARELFWATFVRLLLLYFAPLLLLVVFFHVQYSRLLRDGLRAHLAVIAEHQANTFDLFLRERLVNLGNVMDDPTLAVQEGGGDLEGALATLQQTSDAFVDLGVVSADGDLVSYVGPVVYGSDVNYLKEDWFQTLAAQGSRSVITEIYLGYRDQPHFTLAVRRGEEEDMRILRSALSPERLSEYLRTLEGANEVHAAVVNARGILQVATPRVGKVLQSSPFSPPESPERGFVPGNQPDGGPDYAYAWLSETPFALVVMDAGNGEERGFFGFPNTFLPVTVFVFFIMGVVILVRTRQVVGRQLAAERQEAELSGQLVHAARLASVGELAAGIAHEINNPLAIIAEEVGVLQDSLDPELAMEDDEPVDLPERLEAIYEAVFRCRDITRKLLTFVRQTEVKVEPHYIREILNEVLDVLLGNELSYSNVEVIRDYDYSIPQILTDRNQLIQVFVNLVKNALDAMEGMPGGGTLTVTTRRVGDNASISIKDTGCGMTPDQMERVFMPFFTTKEPGKGTGLGLSVSYSIIQSFGGAFYVESAPAKGSTFTVELPIVVA